MPDYSWRRPRRSEGAGIPRPEAKAGAPGGRLLGRLRKHIKGIVGSIVGAALVAITAWLGGFFDSLVRDIAPVAADVSCAFREKVAYYRHSSDPPKPSDKFTILIATIDGDDASHTYTYAVSRAFSDRKGIEPVEFCRVLRVTGFSHEATAKTVRSAKWWMQQRRADLLIGGRLLKKDEAVDLWFFGNGGTQGFQPTKFSLDANLLKEDFAKAASDQLLTVALAAIYPAAQQGRYLVEILRPVTARLRHLLQDPTGFSAEQRAQLQHALGLGLSAVGEQSGQSQDLADAVAAYRAALTEQTRERVPLEWARTQNGLGVALTGLGERESGTARLEEAVQAYRAALTELTREREPIEWAMTQNNLGTALRNLGARESGPAQLKGAVEAYRAALTELTRERRPLAWAAVQNNLGIVLRNLGARENGTERLEEAVAAYRAALTEQTRERAPLDWARTQYNLGFALWSLGARESGTARLEEAVAAYRAALTEYTRERLPLQWAATQTNLAGVLQTLGERESGPARLEEAVVAYRAALEELRRERVPLQWAGTQFNLAIVFRLLAAHTTGDVRVAYLRDALEAAKGALEVYNAGAAPYDIGREEWLPQ